VTRPARWASWGAVAGWWGYGGSYEPVYYDYGDNVYYEGDSVYVEGQQVATVEEYTEQAVNIAQVGAQTIDNAVQSGTAEELEWLPLGVYAVMEEKGVEPTLFLQLAVTRGGIIGGTQYNVLTNETFAVQGSVDLESQRVAMTIGENEKTILETTVANLTVDESTALVHFGTERTEPRLLVRTESPEVEAGN